MRHLDWPFQKQTKHLLLTSILTLEDIAKLPKKLFSKDGY
jgi:hypothetical protein